jgi:hypothetical protein
MWYDTPIACINMISDVSFVGIASKASLVIAVTLSLKWKRRELGLYIHNFRRYPSWPKLKIVDIKKEIIHGENAISCFSGGHNLNIKLRTTLNAWNITLR